MIESKRIVLATLMLLGLAASIMAQPRSNAVLKNRLASYFRNYRFPITITNKKDHSGLDDVMVDSESAEVMVYANDVFATQPFTPDDVKQIYKDVERLLPGPYNTYTLRIYAHGTLLDELIPCSDTTDVHRNWGRIRHTGNAWVTPISRPYQVTRGLEGRHIALWASHGRYYSSDDKKWIWQRPYLWCTTEDLFTQSIVVPYLMPMLENAGAVLFTPRERDWQKNEVIVDNDTPDAQGHYEETTGRFLWETDSAGFAHLRKTYIDGQNPFMEGSYRVIEAQNNKHQLSSITWTPDIPEDGRYAVYVSYHTLPNSVSDAVYTVRHRGVSTRFRVNQQMGSGTWVYLGTFDFAKGESRRNCVTLTNQSNYRGVITADAVRFGGGMGNIARGDTILSEKACVSGLPRYLEAARYTAQWAGMPYWVYGNKGGTNDYAEDINTRSFMTNLMARGSAYLPSDSGLCVPLEMSLAVHSDAGTRNDRGIIGTLGVYTTEFYDGLLGSGLSRLTSRDLISEIMNSVCHDMQATLGKWNRREMYDRNYSETREPQIPSVILEMLSHQNFADMVYGHDPRFKFTLARSIYKGVARYTAQKHGEEEPIIQPLPVCALSAQALPQEGRILLTWQPVNDPLEPTAVPTEYIIYQSVDSTGYDNGTVCRDTLMEIEAHEGALYRFRIAARNEGGISMLSTEVCARVCPGDVPSILIVNGFDRVASPQVLDNDTVRGFYFSKDPGVADYCTPEYSGRQQRTSRRLAVSTGPQSLGYSGNELQGTLIAGNTHDYPTMHAQDLATQGFFNISSADAAAVERIQINSFHAVDLILGAQRMDGYSLGAYKTFTPQLQQWLRTVSAQGCGIMVSGAYLASDMQSEGDRAFTSEVLHYQNAGEVNSSASLNIRGMNTECSLFYQPNEMRYSVARVDALHPCTDAYGAMLYDETHISAIAYQGDQGRTIAFGFPLEIITEPDKRARILGAALRFVLGI